MKNYFLFVNYKKAGAPELAKELQHYISQKGGICQVSGEPSEDTDCILVLGGDGTFLQASRLYSKHNIPFMGLNLGSLGFLTMTEAPEAFSTLDKLFEDEYKIEHRMQLSCVSGNKKPATALNDVVVSRGGYSHLVGVNVYVNDQLFSAYEGDGVIISTATGSTGYNLSAGGPILTPGINAILITPICPHALGVRSFVISGDDRVKVKIKGTRHRYTESAYVTVDGEGYSILDPEEEIIVEKSEMTCKMCLLSSMSFIDTLKNKFN